MYTVKLEFAGWAVWVCVAEHERVG